MNSTHLGQIPYWTGRFVICFDFLPEEIYLARIVWRIRTKTAPMVHADIVKSNYTAFPDQMSISIKIFNNTVITVIPIYEQDIQLNIPPETLLNLLNCMQSG